MTLHMLAGYSTVAQGFSCPICFGKALHTEVGFSTKTGSTGVVNPSEDLLSGLHSDHSPEKSITVPSTALPISCKKEGCCRGSYNTKRGPHISLLSAT